MRTLVLTLTFLLLAICAGAETITIRSDSWPPYNDDPKDPKAGYMIEVMKAIYEPLGHKIDYRLMSWDDSLKNVQKGKFNAVVGAAREDAEGFIFPEETFGGSKNTFFVLKTSNWVYSDPASIKQVRLGAIEDYSYSETIDEYIKANRKNGKVVFTRGEEALQLLINRLQTGKVDAIVEDASVMFFALLKMKIPLGEIKAVGSPNDTQDIYVAFSPTRPESKEYAQAFDEGIKKLRASGKLQQILTRYNLTDWKK